MRTHYYYSSYNAAIAIILFVVCSAASTSGWHESSSKVRRRGEQSLGFVQLSTSLSESQRLRHSTSIRPCPNDCSRQLGEDRGTCVNGLCRCTELFAGQDCSISLLPDFGEKVPVDPSKSEELKTKSTCTEEECDHICTYGGECVTKATCKCYVDSSHGSIQHEESGKETDIAGTSVFVSDRDGNVLPVLFDTLKQTYDRDINPCVIQFESVVCDTNGDVVELHFSRKHIAASFPKSVMMLPRLRLLSVNNNNIRGPVPHRICKNMPDMEHMLLYRNRLSGSLPRSIGMCRNLVSLVVYGNAFDGSLPSSLWNLHRLRILDLSYNRFSGIVPDKIDELVNLEALYLNNNMFEGEIPFGLSRMWSLQTLRLENNPSLQGGVREVGSEVIYTDPLLDLIPGEGSALGPQYYFSKIREGPHGG